MAADEQMSLLGSSRSTSLYPDAQEFDPEKRIKDFLIDGYEFVLSVLENKFPPLSCDLKDIPLIDEMGKQVFTGTLPINPGKIDQKYCGKFYLQTLIVYGHLHYLFGDQDTAFEFYSLAVSNSSQQNELDGLLAEGFYFENQYVKCTDLESKRKAKLSAITCYNILINHDHVDGYAAKGRFEMKLGLKDEGLQTLTTGMIEGSLWSRFEIEYRNFREDKEESIFEIQELSTMGFLWAIVFMGKYAENAKDLQTAAERYYEAALKDNSCALLFFAQKNLTELGDKSPITGDPENTLIYRRNFYYFEMKKFVEESGFFEDGIKIQLLNKYKFYEDQIEFPKPKYHLGNYFPLPNYTPVTAVEKKIECKETNGVIYFTQ